MADLKTKPNNQSVEAFLNSVENEEKRQDSFALLKMMKEITGEPAKMWGPSIVGFGSYHYVYPTGRSGDMLLAGFSPRKQALTIYFIVGNERLNESFKKLGKHKAGKSCLYIKKLSDIDQKVLRQMIKDSITLIKKRYP